MPTSSLPGWSAAVLVLTSAATHAQARIVSPAENTRREGHGLSYEPFATAATPYRWLQVHDDIVGPLRIERISFRASAYEDAHAATFTYELRLSQAPTTVNAGSIDSTFAGNHGTNYVEHLNQRGTVAARTYDRGELLPLPFTVTLTLPQPYLLGTGERLVWDLKITSRNAPFTGTAVDAVWQPDGGMHLPLRYGQGCARDGQSAPMTHDFPLGVDHFNRTLNTTFALYDGPATGVAAFLLASRPTLPPLLLSTGSVSGDCFLHVDPTAIVLPAAPDASGTAILRLGILPLPRGAAFTLHGQAVAFAPGANASGLITSNGYQNYVGTPTTRPPVGVLQQDLLNTPVPRTHLGLVVSFE